MKVAASSLEMSSTHVAVSQHSVHERLRAWIGQRPDFEAMERGERPRLPAPAANPAATVSLSEAGKAKQARDIAQETQDAVDNDPMLMLLRSVIELMTGHKMEVFDASELTPADAPAVPQLADPNQAAADQANSAPPPNFGVEYDRHESLTESETTHFSAVGVVRTADGQEIRFAIDLSMQRSYHEESSVSLRLGNAQRKDPLVINFAGTAAQLSDQTFSMDLDGDGERDTAHFVASGSGFLVFDRNGNGAVDDRSELFGPGSGDGFQELAALDSDGNGWIDESDAAYSRLFIWSRSGDGKDQLATLAERNVGALGVASIDTPFELKDAANQTLGSIRDTGVYLREDGSGAGTVQQIDLTI